MLAQVTLPEIPVALWNEGGNVYKGIDHLQTYKSNYNQELIVGWFTRVEEIISVTALKGQVMRNQSGLVKILSPWSPMKKAREMMVLPEVRE